MDDREGMGPVHQSLRIRSVTPGAQEQQLSVCVCVCVCVVDMRGKASEESTTGMSSKAWK